MAQTLVGEPVMNIRLSDLWRFDGTVDRGPFRALGAALMVLKLLLDSVVATQLFGRAWSPLDYAMPGHFEGVFTAVIKDRFFYRTMLVVALPFLTSGVALTVRRLRSAGLPLWAVVLFFAPMPMNLIFFLVLGVLPPRPRAVADSNLLDDDWVPAADAVKKPDYLGRTMPRGRWTGALAAILLPLPFATVFTALSVVVLQDYGWGLFVGIPFVLPMISVILYGKHEPRPLGECLGLGMLWLVVAYLMLLVFAFEGMVCLVMALPLAIPVVLLGSAVGYLIQSRPLRSRDASPLLVVLLASLPTLIGAESVHRGLAPVFAVRTAVEIDATPERVWHHVIHFAALPPPEDWFFRTGLAYPIRAEIRGQGVGAVRRCEFSTGPFIEPIEVWDQPRLLRFAVTSNPPPMQEWNPFANIHPPHLHGFLVSRRGEFRLTPLDGGRTRLEGTTWYQHHMEPASYWRLWSDLIIHRIHQRVLQHIQHLAETETRTDRQLGLEPRVSHGFTKRSAAMKHP